MPTHVLVIILGLFANPAMTTALVPFNDLGDCHRTASLVASITNGPMKAFCVDLKTFETVAEVGRS